MVNGVGKNVCLLELVFGAFVWPVLALLLATTLTCNTSFASESNHAVHDNSNSAEQLTVQNYCLPCEENKWRQYSQDAAKLTALDIYDRNDTTKYTHIVNVETVVFKGSNWSIPDVRKAYKKAALVYAQCGIKLNVTAIEISSPIGRVDISYDITHLQGHLHSIVSTLPAASDNVIRDFRVRSIYDADLAIASRSTLTDADLQSFAYANPDMKTGHNPYSNYKNEVWVAAGVKENELYYQHEFSVTAHELGHVLLNCSEQEVPPLKKGNECRPLNDNRPNLMNDTSEYVSNDLVTKGRNNQCARMKNEERDAKGNKIVRNKIIREL